MQNGFGVLNIWINALGWSLATPVILFGGVRFVMIAGSPVSILGLLGGLLILGGLAILWFFATTCLAGPLEQADCGGGSYLQKMDSHHPKLL